MTSLAASSSDAQIRQELLDVLSEVKTKVVESLTSLANVTTTASGSSEGGSTMNNNDLITPPPAPSADELFPIPQFILIGKQSVGKSRIVETMAGEPFNFVSGTLGSRRPTVLEFRNVAHKMNSQNGGTSNQESKWYILEKSQNRWQHHPISKILEILGEAHESLGATVSEIPVNVRLESPGCLDLTIIDLPGFRDFALDQDRQRLSEQIERLNEGFMQDGRNIMLCVEQAGDAANQATLARCRRADPDFNRTILLRNKMDKFYSDLTPDNISEWLEGFGDLPKSLPKFSLTCPHWSDGSPAPGAQEFVKLRDRMDQQDVSLVSGLGCPDRLKCTVGYNNLSRAMERKIELLFSQAVQPVLKKLRDLRENDLLLRKHNLEQEIAQTSPSQIVNAVRECGMSFGHALSHVMEGYVSSNWGRMTLEEELRRFHQEFCGMGGGGRVMPLSTPNGTHAMPYPGNQNQQMLPGNPNSNVNNLNNPYIGWSETGHRVANQRGQLTVGGGTPGKGGGGGPGTGAKGGTGGATISASTVSAPVSSFLSNNMNDAGSFALLPSDDFSTLEEYIQCLREELRVPAMDVEINGGAQFRRLMFEVEVFCRFAEICVKTRKKDVIQARGVAMQSLTWRDVVVKLLSNEAHLPMKRRVRYVGERIKFFFQQQKSVIIDFMKSLRGSPDEQMYSSLFSKTVTILENNVMVKQLVFDCFDRAVDRQLQQFLELFDNTLASTFSNPWVFLKRASTQIDEQSLDDVSLPSFQDTKERIPLEIESRSGIDTILQKWLASIPTEPSAIDDAVDKAQMLLLKTFSFIRAQVADQIELFAESFFKLPMMRRLEEDMSRIELSELDREAHAARLELLQEELKGVCKGVEAVSESIDKLQNFALKAETRRRGVWR